MIEWNRLNDSALYGIVDADISELATLADAMDNNKRRETIKEKLARLDAISSTIEHLKGAAKELELRLKTYGVLPR